MTDRDPLPTGLTDVDGRLMEVLDPEAEARAQADESRVRFMTLGNIGPALIVVVGALVLAYALPIFSFARPWKPGDPVPFWNVVGRPFEAEAVAAEVEAEEELAALAAAAEAEEPPPIVDRKRPTVKAEELGDRLPAYVAQLGDDEAPVQAIELFTGHELDRFFTQLARSDGAVEGAITHVVHWGDSAIGIDGITGAIRRRMQARFGASGQGFHLLEPSNPSYRHQGIRLRTNDLWNLCFIIKGCKRDGHYGLGGGIFTSAGGAESSFVMTAEGDAGNVSRIELWYAAQPRGGNIRVAIDGETRETIATAADALEDRFASFTVPDGHHEVEVRATGGGQVRAYGVTLDRDVPGVSWDGLALIGAFTSRMSNYDEAHLRTQLEHRKADLAVLMFGGNDLSYDVNVPKYEEEYLEVLELLRRARPEMDCLVMSPLDHGERRDGRVVSRAIMPRMVEAQRNAARRAGCAFFDTYAAMGGEGSAGRWYRQNPRLMSADLAHATSRGHSVVGELVHRAIVDGYVRFRKR